MTNRDRRQALRGAEEETFDLLAEALTPKKWAELLEAPLVRAVAKGNRGLAQKLLGAGAETGPVLHDALEGGNAGIMSDLLEDGTSTAETNMHGDTVLHVAARGGETEIVQLLLLKGADISVDALGSYERTPLYLAASRGHVAAALALLAAGADVHLRCRMPEQSVIHAAARGGRAEILRAVLEHGVDVNQEDLGGCTPLHTAAVYDKAEAINALVEAGGNIEAQRRSFGDRPLHDAARQSNLEASVALLKQGAHVNSCNDDLQTPLLMAATHAGTLGTADVVDYLLRSGADEAIVDSNGQVAAGAVGIGVEEENQVVDDVERVRKLLANAPADRAWRRRGYLVLCRAHPDRVQLVPERSSASAGVAQRTGSDTKLAKTEASGCIGTDGVSTADERACDADWADVIAKVLRLQEEGIFRKIVGYL